MRQNLSSGVIFTSAGKDQNRELEESDNDEVLT